MVVMGRRTATIGLFVMLFVMLVTFDSASSFCHSLLCHPLALNKNSLRTGIPTYMHTYVYTYIYRSLSASSLHMFYLTLPCFDQHPHQFALRPQYLRWPHTAASTPLCSLPRHHPKTPLPAQTPQKVPHVANKTLPAQMATSPTQILKFPNQNPSRQCPKNARRNQKRKETGRALRAVPTFLPLRPGASAATRQNPAAQTRG